MSNQCTLLRSVLFYFVLLSEVPDCQGQTSHACTTQPCQNGGTCLINSRVPAEFLCHCSEFYNGTFCDNYIGPEDCAVNPCLNGGQCFQGVNNRILCQCLERYSGLLCQQLDVSPCESDPCSNDGECTVNDSGYSCSCAPGYAGATCSLSIRSTSMILERDSSLNILVYGTVTDVGCSCYCAPKNVGATCNLSIRATCASFPCSNGGTCFVSSYDVQDYYCMCTAGFYGDNCQLSVIECSCENGGSCHNMNLPHGGIGLQCLCPPGYTGSRCEMAPTNVCDAEPCGSGDCFLDVTNQTEYYCNCHAGYGGDHCEIQLNQGSCLTNPCLNSGSCSSLISSGTEYTLCDCPPGYVGFYCEKSAEGCAPNPCLNNGLCLASSPTTVTCQCSVGYVGPRCEHRGACFSSPCLNNGTCYNAYQPQDEMPGFACACPEGYHGLICSETTSSDPCASTPCLNGGICLKNVDSDVFVCICSVGFEGDLCERREGALCAANPTACDGPGEICLDNGHYLYCECQGSWRRNDDDTECHAPCTISPCDNGGECYLLENREEFYCVCPEGFTGQNCEDRTCTNSLPRTLTNTMCSAEVIYCTGTAIGPCESCMNEGMCVMHSNALFCDCVNGYTGIDCSIPPTVGPTTVNPGTPCFDGACKNGGTCLPFAEIGGYHCICAVGFTGLDCSNNTRTMTPEPPKTTRMTTTRSTTTKPLIQPNKDAGICVTVNPCVNGAICLPNTDRDGELYPMCLCRPGYGGSTCSVRLPIPRICQRNPCGPDAVCYSNASTFTGYSCMCLRADGLCSGSIFAGVTTPPVTSSPCESAPCMNNGTCIEEGDWFRCDCPPFIVGDMCETDIRECTYMDSRYNEGDIRSEGCIECNCTNGDWQCTVDSCYCEHDDKLYENGQTWTDQCMTCFCYNGGWLCSDSDCSNTCEHNGNRYFDGDVREESCETCFCSNKNWTCTAKDNCDYCLDGDAVYFEGSSRNDDCNVCTCTTQGWQCTVKDCDELPLTLNISFHLDYPYSLISDRQNQLIRVIKAHMEAGFDLPLDQLIGISLSEGSIIVNMTLFEAMGTDEDIRHIASNIKEKVSSGTLKIAFDGYFIPAKADSYSEVTITQELSNSFLLIFILSAVFILTVIMMFTIIFCLCKKNNRSLSRSRKSQSRRRLVKSKGGETSDEVLTLPNWDNKGGGDSKDRDLVVMTCPGRLRQVGLEGIKEEQ